MDLDAFIRFAYRQRWGFTTTSLHPRLWYHIMFALASTDAPSLTDNDLAALVPLDVGPDLIASEFGALLREHNDIHALLLLDRHASPHRYRLRAKSLRTARATICRLENLRQSDLFPNAKQILTQLGVKGLAKYRLKVGHKGETLSFSPDIHNEESEAGHQVAAFWRPFRLRIYYFHTDQDVTTKEAIREVARVLTDRQSYTLRHKAGAPLQSLFVAQSFTLAEVDSAANVEGITLLTFTDLCRFVNPITRPPRIPRLDDWLALFTVRGLASRRVLELIKRKA